MHDYLLVASTCLFFLPAFNAGECLNAVLAARVTSYVPAGGSLSLSCLVQHCGQTWTGGWMWMNSTDRDLRAVVHGARNQVTRVSLSANQTKLLLSFWRVDESDEGSYACKVAWDEGGVDQGRFTYLNVTAAVPFQRKLWHRIVVWAGASLCLPVILLLARCSSSEVTPQPLPRTWSALPVQHAAADAARPRPPPRRPVPQKRAGAPSPKACPEPRQKTEVVYADISKQALSQQPAKRQPAQSTIYSLPKFSS